MLIFVKKEYNMCLYVDKIFHTKKEAIEFYNKPLIAKEEIKVYKLLCLENGKYYSPHRSYRYYKGFQYTESKFSKRFNCFNELCISKGLHAYTTYKACHDVFTFDYSTIRYVIIEMYIPKGSKYFLGKRNEIVTDNLIWY